jgi:hypothetical protein
MAVAKKDREEAEALKAAARMAKEPIEYDEEEKDGKSLSVHQG